MICKKFRGNPFWLTRQVVLGAFFCIIVPFCVTYSKAHAANSESDNLDSALYFSVGDTVRVTASPLGDPVFRQSTGLVTVQDLEDHTGGADLGELLSRVAGLQVRRYGGLGAPVVPSIRGGSAAQVMVLVDGLPLVDSQTGTIDLSTLPLERYSQAEIYRGLVPAGMGGIGAAGAINLISRENPQGSTSVRAFTGSFGDVGGRITNTLVSGSGSLALDSAVHVRRADNRFKYIDRNQTFSTTADDFKAFRENAWFEEWGGYLRGSYLPDGYTLQTTLGYFRKDSGRPGPLGFSSEQARLRTRRYDARISIQKDDRLWALDLAAGRKQEDLYDYEGDILIGSPGSNFSTSEDVYGRLVTAPVIDMSAVAGFLPHGAIDITAGVDGRKQWYDLDHWNSFYDQTRTEPQRNRTIVSVFSSAGFNFYSPRIHLTPAWRWQQMLDNFPPVPALPYLPEKKSVSHLMEAVSPSLSLMWEVIPASFYMEAHASKWVRQPTWVELFGFRGTIDGNRDLLPEEITSFDVAGRWLSDNSKTGLRLAIFQAQTDDTIIWVQNSQRTSSARNFGKTRTYGVEFEGHGVLPGGGNWSGNLTAQKARDLGDDPTYRDKELPFLPEMEMWLLVNKTFGGWTPACSIFYQSSNYRDRYNQPDNQLDSRTTINLSLNRKWESTLFGAGTDLALTGEVLNITDNRLFDIEGYPLPGRTFRFSVSLTQ